MGKINQNQLQLESQLSKSEENGIETTHGPCPVDRNAITQSQKGKNQVMEKSYSKKSKIKGCLYDKLELL